MAPARCARMHAFLSFLAIGAVALVVPGPDTFVVLRTSLADGPRAGTWAAAGLATRKPSTIVGHDVGARRRRAAGRLRHRVRHAQARRRHLPRGARRAGAAGGVARRAARRGQRRRGGEPSPPPPWRSAAACPATSSTSRPACSGPRLACPSSSSPQRRAAPGGDGDRDDRARVRLADRLRAPRRAAERRAAEPPRRPRGQRHGRRRAARARGAASGSRGTEGPPAAPGSYVGRWCARGSWWQWRSPRSRRAAARHRAPLRRSKAVSERPAGTLVYVSGSNRLTAIDVASGRRRVRRVASLAALRPAAACHRRPRRVRRAAEGPDDRVLRTARAGRAAGPARQRPRLRAVGDRGPHVARGRRLRPQHHGRRAGGDGRRPRHRGQPPPRPGQLGRRRGARGSRSSSAGAGSRSGTRGPAGPSAGCASRRSPRPGAT